MLLIYISEIGRQTRLLCMPTEYITFAPGNLLQLQHSMLLNV